MSGTGGGVTPVAFHGPVPAHAGPRLAANLDRLVRSFQNAVAASTVTGAQAARCQRALSLLKREQSAVAAAVGTAQGDGAKNLMERAAQLRFLTRRMDGYPLDFAGPTMAKTLEDERRLVVLTACQIIAAASGSGASGL